MPSNSNFFFNDRIFFIVQGFLKYVPFDWAISFRRFCYRPFFKKMGKNTRIKDGTTFKFPSEIELGDNCVIGEYCYFVGKSGLKIGNNLLMGAGSKIITSNHRFERRDLTIREQGISFTPIEMEDDIWLGFDVKILGGSYIAKGCIIGTGTLINKEFREPFKIIVGVPGKVEGERPQ